MKPIPRIEIYGYCPWNIEFAKSRGLSSEKHYSAEVVLSSKDKRLVVSNHFPEKQTRKYQQECLEKLKADLLIRYGDYLPIYYNGKEIGE